jgi:hypothetical protein
MIPIDSVRPLIRDISGVVNRPNAIFSSSIRFEIVQDHRSDRLSDCRRQLFSENRSSVVMGPFLIGVVLSNARHCQDSGPGTAEPRCGRGASLAGRLAKVHTSVPLSADDREKRHCACQPAKGYRITMHVAAASSFSRMGVESGDPLLRPALPRRRSRRRRHHCCSLAPPLPPKSPQHSAPLIRK